MREHTRTRPSGNIIALPNKPTSSSIFKRNPLNNSNNNESKQTSTIVITSPAPSPSLVITRHHHHHRNDHYKMSYNSPMRYGLLCLLICWFSANSLIKRKKSIKKAELWWLNTNTYTHLPNLKGAQNQPTFNTTVEPTEPRSVDDFFYIYLHTFELWFNRTKSDTITHTHIHTERHIYITQINLLDHKFCKLKNMECKQFKATQFKRYHSF